MAHEQDSSSEDTALSRRSFVTHVTFLGGGAVLLDTSCAPRSAPDAGPPAARAEALVLTHRSFTEDEWLLLNAVVDRVLPKDEDAGGVEVGVPEYIDRMLQTPAMTTMKENFPPGLKAVDRRCRRLHQVPFTQASPAQQDEVLTIFKESPPTSGEARWYEMLIVLCLEGYLGDPSYGGNKDYAGWKTVGFELVSHADTKPEPFPADPRPGYDGTKALHALTCGGGKGC